MPVTDTLKTRSLSRHILGELCELAHLKRLYLRLVHTHSIGKPLTVEHAAPAVFHSGMLLSLSYRAVAGSPAIQYELSGLDTIRGTITEETTVHLDNGESYSPLASFSPEERTSLEEEVCATVELESLTVDETVSYDDLDLLAQSCGVALEPTMARYSKKRSGHPIARVIRTKISIAHGHTVLVLRCSNGVEGFYVAQTDEERESVIATFGEPV